MKIIAIQDNLHSLKNALENFGYTVVYSSEINGPVDAYIYYEEDNKNSLLMVNQQLNNVFSSLSTDMYTDTNMPPKNGTLIINAKNKTVEEIHRILKNRTYTPLF